MNLERTVSENQSSWHGPTLGELEFGRCGHHKESVWCLNPSAQELSRFPEVIKHLFQLSLLCLAVPGSKILICSVSPFRISNNWANRNAHSLFLLSYINLTKTSYHQNTSSNHRTDAHLFGTLDRALRDSCLPTLIFPVSRYLISVIQTLRWAGNQFRPQSVILLLLLRLLYCMNWSFVDVYKVPTPWLPRFEKYNWAFV